MTIKELDQQLSTSQAIFREHIKCLKDSFSPEQIKQWEILNQFREENIHPTWSQREELKIKELIDKAKKEDPFIKEIIKEIPVSSSLENPSTSNLSRQHYLLPLLVKSLKARCHTWLVGPAGGGKSTAASNAADALNLPFASLSVCSQTTKTDLLGYLDATGVYRSTSFRNLYENGGVFCLDEIDNGNANVLAVLNSALSSEQNNFPDKTVKKHPNFVVVACANTYGLGATNGYVGRVQIDAATLDRFFFIEIPYDNGLELHLAGIPNQSSPLLNLDQEVPTDKEWLEIVTKTREAVSRLGLRIIISPRATYMGLSLIKQGITLNYLKKGLLYKSASDELIAKINQS